MSGQRREGVRLVSGARRDFGLSSTLDFVHVPYPPPSRTWTRRTLTCGVALQCSPSKERIVDYRLNELSARELSALTLVEAAVALGWIAENWPGLLPEIRRLLPDLEVTAGDMDAEEMLNRAVALARTSQHLVVDPLLGTLPRAYTDPQGLTDKLRRTFGQDAVDHVAEATAAAVLGSRRRRRRRAQPQPAAAEPAAGQRPRRDARAPSRHPVSGVERVDERLHADHVAVLERAHSSRTAIR